jgi:hypothetical protein
MRSDGRDPRDAEHAGEFVPRDVHEQRLRICMGCPYITRINLLLASYHMCRVCGCAVALKTRFRRQHCPKQKW